MLNEYYNPNNVNADNFNETMQGYLEYAINFCESNKDTEFTDEHISTIRSGFNWAKDEMTMQDARKYTKHF